MTEDTYRAVLAIAQARREPPMEPHDWLLAVKVLEARAANPATAPDIAEMDREAAARIRRQYGVRA